MGTSLASSSLSSGTGLDVGATVDQLMIAERAPERLLQSQQQTLSAQASALRDLNNRLETLETRINTLKDITGAFGQMNATSSNESVFSATAGTSASAGDHLISVTQLATVASQYSDPPAASADSAFIPGTLQFAIGGGDTKSITFDAAHSTLASAATYINSQNLGVTASLVSSAIGTRLVLISTTPGKAGDIAISSSPDGLGFKVGTAGQNAKLTVDGVPLESSTNKVESALPGITLQLNGDTSGISTRLTVASDTAGARQAITNFVSAYNDLIGKINSQFQYNALTQSSGVLAGDGTVRSVQATLLSFASFQAGTGTLTTLRSIGIEMQNDGTLQINDATITTALHNVPEVKSFFQNDSGNGFAQKLGSTLMALTDSVTGPLLLDAKGLDDSYKSIGKQIDAFEVRMEAREKQLTDEYTRIDVMLRQMASMETQISKQLESLG